MPVPADVAHLLHRRDDYAAGVILLIKSRAGPFDIRRRVTTISMPAAVAFENR